MRSFPKVDRKIRVCRELFVMLLFIVMNERVRRDNTQSVQTTVLYYGQWLPFSTKDYVIDTTSRSRSTILSIHINILSSLTMSSMLERYAILTITMCN